MENTPVPPPTEIHIKQVSEDTPNTKKRKKKKGRVIKTILKIIIWIIVIAVVIFLTLFLTSRIAEFDTILDMLEYIRGQLN